MMCSRRAAPRAKQRAPFVTRAPLLSWSRSSLTDPVDRHGRGESELLARLGADGLGAIGHFVGLGCVAHQFEQGGILLQYRSHLRPVGSLLFLGCQRLLVERLGFLEFLRVPV